MKRVARTLNGAGWAAGFRAADGVLAALDDLLERLHTRRLGDLPTALVLLAPALAILGAFGFAPLVATIAMSLRGGKFDSGAYVGLGNYADAFGGDALRTEGFWDSFWVTVYYAAGTIPVTLVLSFLAAQALFRLGRGRGLLRTLYFLPYVTSAVAAAMVWRGLFNPQFGILNTLLARLGTTGPQWLLEPRSVLHLASGGAIAEDVGPSLALCCVMAFDCWHELGFMVVIFLAGLTRIPRELEESARIDGASRWQTTWRITLPLLSPTVFFLAIVSVIKSFQAFNSFYALTGNGRGPSDATQNLTVYIYTQFYEYQWWGYAAAVATLLCTAIIGLTVLQWRFVGRRVYYR